MDEFVIDNIEFQLEFDPLLTKLHIQKGSSYANELARIFVDAQVIVKPKAVYRVVFIDSKGDDYVVVDGIMLDSRVLRINLEQANRIFPYVATCGTELEDWSRSFDNILTNYWVDTIKEVALQTAIQALDKHLQDQFHPGRISIMNPGSLEDWPLQEQRKLFALLGNLTDVIGVQLTESLVMTPIKSVSGIRFPTEVDFESCQLCPRINCNERRAPYDEDLYDKKYRLRSN